MYGKIFIYLLIGIVLGILPVGGLFELLIVLFFASALSKSPLIKSSYDVLKSYLGIVIGQMFAISIIYIVFGLISDISISWLSQTSNPLLILSLGYLGIILYYSIIYLTPCYIIYYTSFNPDDIENNRDKEKELEKMSRK